MVFISILLNKKKYLFFFYPPVLGQDGEQTFLLPSFL